MELATQVPAALRENPACIDPAAVPRQYLRYLQNAALCMLSPKWGVINVIMPSAKIQQKNMYVRITNNEYQQFMHNAWKSHTLWHPELRVVDLPAGSVAVWVEDIQHNSHTFGQNEKANHC
eukprot:2698172-Amphidinium_carterae.1